MFQKQKQTVNLLELTPVHLCQYALNEAGRVTVFEPRFRTPFWNRILPHKLVSKDIKISLDEMGSAVWRQINGEQNVMAICRALQDQFGEKVSPAEERVTKFISQLFGNKMIRFKEIDT